MKYYDVNTREIFPGEEGRGGKGAYSKRETSRMDLALPETRV